MPGNPFAAVIEACGQSAHGYSPDNALRVIEWYEGMPELIEAIAGMLRHQGAKTLEEFFLYPQAGEFAQKLGALFLHYKDPCEQAHHAFATAHAKDIARVKDPQRNQYKWDISLNKD